MTTITTNAKTISVTSDYNSEFVTEAKLIGGKWQNPSWVFDIRNEDRVRALCLKIYGTDGLVTDVVDVRVTYNREQYEYNAPLELFGKTLARAFGRDSGAKLGDNIVVEEGGFTSGGSIKNWTTRASKGTVFILRDISRALVESHGDEDISVEIIESVKPVDVEQLKTERSRLVARIAEIDAQLNDL